MRSFFLACFFVVSCLGYSSLSYNSYYDAFAESYVRRGNVLYSLSSGWTANSPASADDPYYPYNGGAFADQTEDGLFRAISFYEAASVHNPVSEGWSSSILQGWVEAPATAAYPVGTLLELEVLYQTANYYQDDSEYSFYRAMMRDEGGQVVLDVSHSAVSGGQLYTFPIVAGGWYSFRIENTYGSSSSPVITTSHIKFTGVGLSFTLNVPEPATLLLLGMGAVMVRRRK